MLRYTFLSILLGALVSSTASANTVTLHAEYENWNLPATNEFTLLQSHPDEEGDEGRVDDDGNLVEFGNTDFLTVGTYTGTVLSVGPEYTTYEIIVPVFELYNLTNNLHLNTVLASQFNEEITYALPANIFGPIVLSGNCKACAPTATNNPKNYHHFDYDDVGSATADPQVFTESFDPNNLSTKSLAILKLFRGLFGPTSGNSNYLSLCKVNNCPPGQSCLPVDLVSGIDNVLLDLSNNTYTLKAYNTRFATADAHLRAKTCKCLNVDLND